MLDNLLKNVAVLGAAGKMGSGISLLLLQEIALLQAQSKEKYRLHLVDTNEDGLSILEHYLYIHLIKFAETSISRIRKFYSNNADLISNEEIVDAFVQGGMRCLRFSSSAKGCSLIFEAVIEDVELKSKIFSSLQNEEAYFFTNTSSIPISLLNKKAGLNNRIIGYHFFNPPAVQKLLEIITYDTIDPKLVTIADELAKRLKKIVVHSKDIAGFIGNGHFIRELIYACKKVEQFPSKTEGVYFINQVTQNFLIRPMGIFQLADYVGLDVCQKIMGIMSLNAPLLNEIISCGIKGFFQYEGLKPIKIYSFEKKEYVPFPQMVFGDLPKGHQSWNKKPKKEIIDLYLKTLSQEKTPGALLANEFLKNSHEITLGLIKDGVAKNIEDVNTVLMQGFYHLYGVHS